MANEEKYPRNMLCPLVDRIIEDIDCLETQDAAERILKESSLPPEYTRRDNWREICKACKYHEKS
jgi:hypothetical protein